MTHAIMCEPFIILVRKWSLNTTGLVLSQFVLAEKRVCMPAQFLIPFSLLQ